MKFEYQPIDGMNIIVTAQFDEMPDLFDDDERTAWNLQQGLNVCRWVAKTSGAMAAFSGILAELGEVPAWEFLADVADHSGFDVYNGDGIFEVYERSTVPATVPMRMRDGEGAEMPRQSVEDRIQKEIEKVDDKIQQLEQRKGELVSERTQLIAARNALGSPTVTEAGPKNG